MKKLVILLFLVLIVGGVLLWKYGSGKTGQPKVIDLFACGDYCPEPASNYTVKVYEGVENKEQCLLLGGEWKSYTGWGVTYYCKAQ